MFLGNMVETKPWVWRATADDAASDNKAWSLYIKHLVLPLHMEKEENLKQQICNLPHYYFQGK